VAKLCAQDQTVEFAFLFTAICGFAAADQASSAFYAVRRSFSAQHQSAYLGDYQRQSPFSSYVSRRFSQRNLRNLQQARKKPGGIRLYSTEVFDARRYPQYCLRLSPLMPFALKLNLLMAGRLAFTLSSFLIGLSSGYCHVRRQWFLQPGTRLNFATQTVRHLDVRFRPFNHALADHRHFMASSGALGPAAELRWSSRRRFPHPTHCRRLARKLLHQNLCWHHKIAPGDNAPSRLDFFKFARENTKRATSDSFIFGSPQYATPGSIISSCIFPSDAVLAHRKQSSSVSFSLYDGARFQR